MKYTSLFTLSFAWIVTSCDGEPARIRVADKKISADDGTRGLDLAGEIKNAENQKSELITQKAEWDEQLSTLRLTNNRMCERLFAHRTQCPVAARLRSTDNEKVLGCVGNYEEGARLVPKYSVKVTSPQASGTFFLRADNDYDSTPFANGVLTEVEWKPIASSDTQTPRIWDLSQMKLRANLGGVIQKTADTKFEFWVNNKLLLTEADLNAVGGSSTSLDVSLAKLIDWKLQSAETGSPCQITDEEFDEIISGAKIDAQSEAGFNLEEQEATFASESDVRKLEALKSEIASLKKVIGDVNLNIDRESDRSGKLVKELQGERAVGCFAKQPIKLFELEITGDHLPIKEGVVAKEKRNSEGSPAQFVFRFGDQFAKTHPDEEKEALFVAGGHLVERGFSTKRIGDIEHIIIEKGGIGFESEVVCTGGLFKKCNWKSSEKNIYRLDALTLKVNGEVVYRQDDVNFTFQEGKLVWSDKNITLNHAYRALMRRTDCPAQ
jgi:hypothetical protein